MLKHCVYLYSMGLWKVKLRAYTVIGKGSVSWSCNCKTVFIKLQNLMFFVFLTQWSDEIWTVIIWTVSKHLWSGSNKYLDIQWSMVWICRLKQYACVLLWQLCLILDLYAGCLQYPLADSGDAELLTILYDFQCNIVQKAAWVIA